MLKVYVNEDKNNIVLHCDGKSAVVDESIFQMSHNDQSILNRLGQVYTKILVRDYLYSEEVDRIPDHILNDVKVGEVYTGRELHAYGRGGMVVVNTKNHISFHYEDTQWKYGNDKINLVDTNDYKIVYMK